MLSITNRVHLQTITVTDIKIEDNSTAGKFLILDSDSTTALDADKTLTIDVDNTSPTLKIGANLTVEATSAINQDLTTDAAASFGSLSLTTDLPVIHGGTGVGLSTGTTAVVLSNSPTLVTPVLGAATGTSLSVTAGMTVNSGNLTGETGVNFYSIVDGSSDPTFSTITQSDAEGIGNSSDLRIGLDPSLMTLNILPRANIGTDLVTSAATHPTLRVWDNGVTDNIALYHNDTDGYLETNAGGLRIQNSIAQDVTFWEGIGAGNPGFYIYGWDTSAVKYGLFQVDSSGMFNIHAQESIKINDDTKIIDNKIFGFGNVNDGSIQYDEAGDDTMQLSLPTAGMSFRTDDADNDNAGLIKVAKVVVTAADMTNVGATDNVALTAAALPANAVLLSAKFVLDVQFSGGSVSDVDCTIGLTGDEDGLIIPGAHNLTSDSVGIEKTTKGAYWDGTDANSGTYWNSSAQTWVAYFTAVADTWNNITAGQITFYVMYVHAPQT